MCGGYELCRWCYELLRTERIFAVITRSTRALILVECVKMLTSTELYVTMRLTVRVISLEVRLMQLRGIGKTTPRERRCAAVVYVVYLLSML